MSATRNVPFDCVDQIDQLLDELVTIWLALGNSADMADDYLVIVREALNGTTSRLRDVCREMEGGARS
jgi:hypothetical protein